MKTQLTDEQKAVIKHSPLPWSHKAETKISYNSNTGEKYEETSHWVYDANGKFTCITNNYNNGPTDGSYIAHAASILPELIEMLERVERCYEDGESFPTVEVDEIIKRAKGGV